MKNTKLTRNEDKTFNVVDTRTGEVVKARVSGGDAAAYRVYYEEMLVEAEANWEILGGDRETKEEEETTTTNPIKVSTNGVVMATINLETITEMYYAKLEAVNTSLANPEVDSFNKDMLLIKQSEIMGAITAIGKVREMEHYNEHHDILSSAQRRCIVERVTTVR